MTDLSENTQICAFKIKFQDLKRGEHRISLPELCKSLQGFATVFAVVGTQAIDGTIPIKQSDFRIDVETDAELSQGSVELMVFISSLFKKAADVVSICQHIKTVCKFLFSKRTKSDMDKFLEYLNKRDQKDLESQKIQAKQIADLANSLLSATEQGCKLAVSLLGRECKNIELSDKCDKQEAPFVEIDKDVKLALQHKPQAADEVSQEYNIVIFALNLKTKSCRFYMAEEYENADESEETTVKEYSGYITDPNFESTSNAYTRAFDRGCVLNVTAKLKRNTNNPSKNVYYISDALEAAPGDAIPSV